MRVTQNTMTQSLIRYLTAQNEALYDRQRIIATQKRINKPSDDPIGMGKVLDYRQTLATIDQYQTNIQTGMTRLDVTESTLKLVDDLLQVVRAIGQTEAAGTTESRLLAAEEVKRLYDQIMDLANTTQNDNYLFSGYLTKTAPFSRDDTRLTTFDKFTASYNGDSGDVNFIVATNTEVSIDADGQPIFHDAASGGVNIFDHLRDLIVGLENDDSDAISSQTGMLDQGRTQINNIRAANASIYYQLEITERHWQTYEPKIQDLMAQQEEADITKAVVELQHIELAYQTTLATAARVIQPGLVQFLK
ncbi:MAG: flagellar hook-associated protein FlgL [Desulfobacterales bacterium]|nr:flagellar hook-associated protein FlgL [Desulfobacterales bacterium]